MEADEKETQVRRDEKGRVLEGSVLNPAGRPPAPPELKEARKFTKARYEEILHRVSAMTMDELQSFIKEKKGDVLETAIAAIMVKCINQGDFTRLEGFTNRIVGPVEKKIQLNAGSLAEFMLKFHENNKSEEVPDEI